MLGAGDVIHQRCINIGEHDTILAHDDVRSNVISHVGGAVFVAKHDTAINELGS